jgi:RNA polymerase sigma factor (sigma-70 family)
VRDRDEAAFELLVWRHGAMVLGVCRRALRDEHAAEDAFQATFLALARKAGGITRGGAVAAWLCRVALRVALRARAAAARRPAQTLPADLPAPSSDPSMPRDWQSILDEEINRLPERYRRPVVLCHLQGHTLAQAARELGCPRGTVAVRLVRARHRLRARLARRGLALAAAFSAALASERLVSAALVKATARAAAGYVLGGAANALPPSVLTLTEGVLRAMLISKIKFVSAVLVAVALAVAGTAWVAYRADAGELPGAGERVEAKAPPAPRGEPDRRAEEAPPADRRRAEARERLERAEKLLRSAEAEFDEREKHWLDDLIEARLKVLELREALTAKESNLDDAIRAADRQAELRLRLLVADRERVAHQLEEAKKNVAKDGKDPVLHLTADLDGLEEQVQKRQQELEQWRSKARDDKSATLRGPRRDLMIAEEKVRALERRQERQRDEARRDLEEQARRVREWRNALDDEPPTESRAADVERKLDQVLRELSELRRSLRAREEDRPEQP